MLRRPGMNINILGQIYPDALMIRPDILEQIAIQAKYAGYIIRQLKEVSKFKDLEKMKIPEGFEYTNLSGISKEIQEKLTKGSPISLGQASRVSGVTPAAIMLLMIHLKKYWEEKKKKD